MQFLPSASVTASAAWLTMIGTRTGRDNGLNATSGVYAQFNQDVYDGYTLNLHVGHQNVKNNGAASYSDWKVGVTKDFGVVTVALAAIYADSDAYIAPNGKNLAKTGAVLSISKTF